MNMQELAQELNATATSIRREGSVPRFQNYFTMKVAGKPMDFDYDGQFEYAEVQSDRPDCLVVRYDGRFIRFHHTQVENISVYC